MRISDWSSDVCSADLPSLMALPVRFAQLGLEDLADGGKRKRLAAQFDAARDLVARDQSAAVILDRGKVGLALGPRNDDGLNTPAPARRGDADDRDRPHVWIGSGVGRAGGRGRR